MCLITTQKEPKTAIADITVYKSLIKKGDRICSLFHYYEYELNKLYKTKMEEDDSWICYDQKDSQYLDTNYPEWNTGECADKLVCIGAGYHTATSAKRLSKVSEDESVYSCIVPKGSKYYIDETGLMVSNQLIIKKLYRKSRNEVSNNQ